MGGPGSGPNFASKDTTSRYGRLDIRRWQRQRLLLPFESFPSAGWHVEVVPSLNGGAQPEGLMFSRWNNRKNEFFVPLEWTQCNYGGFRPWFLCPQKECGHRVAILYFDSALACRHCRNLVYDTQRQRAPDRALRRAQMIRISLGGSASLAEPFPPKPKGMHLTRYLSLRCTASEAEQIVMSHAIQFIDRFELRGRLAKESRSRR